MTTVDLYLDGTGKPANFDRHVMVRDVDTVWVTLGAPGIGQGWSCRQGHYVGTSSVMSLD